MKKIAYLVGIAALALVSCKKEPITEPVSKGPEIITLLSPDGGEIFTAGDSVTVTWKTDNIADTARIVARLINESEDGVGMGELLVPAKKIPIELYNKDIYVTLNDGIEVFRLPDYSSNLYSTRDGSRYFSYGKTFLIQIVCIVLKDGKWVEGTVQPLYDGIEKFTIHAPPMFAGCSSYQGYSSTTGQPCSVPH